jgi:hypothetical protein
VFVVAQCETESVESQMFPPGSRWLRGDRCAECRWRTIDAGDVCRVCNELSAECVSCRTIFPPGCFTRVPVEYLETPLNARGMPNGDYVCRHCVLRWGACPRTLSPVPQFHELHAERINCNWCGCDIWDSDRTDAGDCSLCIGGEQVVPTEFWEDLAEARGDVVTEFQHCRGAAVAVRVASGDCRLLRYHYGGNQPGNRAERQYMGRPEWGGGVGGASIHAYGTGLWCPQYLRNSLGLQVQLGVENSPVATGKRKRAARLSLMILLENHPVYSSPNFRAYLHAPDEIEGITVRLDRGGICGIVSHASPQSFQTPGENGFFIARDAGSDRNPGNMKSKHKALTKLWESLLGIEFPLLFPRGFGLPSGVSTRSFLRQYFARPQHSIFAELNQELLVKYAVNERTKAILSFIAGFSMRSGGLPATRLPPHIRGSMAEISRARAVAFAIARQFGAPCLFCTVTMSDEWREIQHVLRQWDGHTSYTAPAPTARAFRGKMTQFLNSVSEIYGDVVAYVFSDEWQHRGRPHRHILLWLKVPILTMDGFDDFVDRGRVWLPDFLQDVAARTFSHQHGTRCIRPGCLKCKKGYPADLRAVTVVDDEGFLQSRCLLGEEYFICIDKKSFGRLRCHTNTVGGGGARKIKYLIKYQAKRGSLVVYSDTGGGPILVEREGSEPTTAMSGMVISASEAAYDLYGVNPYGHWVAGGGLLSVLVTGETVAGLTTPAGRYLDRPAIFANWSLVRFLKNVVVTADKVIIAEFYRLCTDAVAYEQETGQAHAIPRHILKTLPAIGQNRRVAKDAPLVVHVHPDSRKAAYVAWLLARRVVDRADIIEANADRDASMRRFGYPGYRAAMVFATFIEEMLELNSKTNVIGLLLEYWMNFQPVAREHAVQAIVEAKVYSRERLLAAVRSANLPLHGVEGARPGSTFPSELEEWEYYSERHAARARQKQGAFAAFMWGTLLPGQASAVVEIIDGDTGPGDVVVVDEAAGAGKAYVIDALRRYHEERGEVVILWGSSGQAAVVIGGVTIHFGTKMSASGQLGDLDPELAALIVVSKIIIVDEWALADAHWLRTAAERVRHTMRKYHEMKGLPPPPGGAWCGKRLRLFGDTYQLGTVLRELDVADIALMANSEPAASYLQTLTHRRVAIRNERNPRYLCEDWSRFLNRVRIGDTSEVAVNMFGQIIAANGEYDYRWLKKRLRKHGIERLNKTEIVVGRHSERRKILQIVEESLKAVPSKTYVPQWLVVDDPSIEFPDMVGVEPVTLHMGERVALTNAVKTRSHVYPTNTRGIVEALHKTHVEVRTEGTGELLRVPLNASEQDVGMESVMTIMLGVRPACANTVHSFQGRTVEHKEGSVFVVSLNTMFFSHGMLYSILSRVRLSSHLTLYRETGLISLPNVIEPRFLLPPQPEYAEGTLFFDGFVMPV